MKHSTSRFRKLALAPSALRPAAGLACMGVTVTVALAASVAFAAALLSAPHDRSVEPGTAGGGHAAAAPATRGDESSIRRTALGVDFEHHALNALIVPLLEPGDPPRWSDPAWSAPCEPPSRISIDGVALEPGKPMPAKAFTLHWDMVNCQPFGASALWLNGRLEIDVFHDEGGLSAIVRPERLSAAHGASRYVLSEPFTAALALGAGD